MQKDLKSLFGDHHGLDERSVSALTRALANENLPGFDYIEFKQALARLRDMGMDEATAFRSAYATASTMGLTKEKLLKTAQHYKKVLDNENEHFEESLKRQMEQRVKAKMQEVEKMKKQVAEFQGKIEELENKIKSLESKIKQGERTIASADEDIQAAKDKLLSTKDAFQHALQSISNEIQKDIESMESYL
jgi:chromosome segregation ATPase